MSVPQVYPATSTVVEVRDLTASEGATSSGLRYRLARMLHSMAPVVRAGDDGWSVMVQDLAPLRAARRDGNAVPILGQHGPALSRD